MTPKGSRPVLRGLVGSNAHPATQLIDFLAVLFGYAISRERTLEAFFARQANRGAGGFHDMRQEAYEALQEVRDRAKTPAFQALYAKRAGIEGTVAQAVRTCELRRASSSHQQR